MTRKLLKRRGWRAPAPSPDLIAELDHCCREAEDAFGKPLASLTPNELRDLARDIRIRADSAADHLEILAESRARRDRLIRATRNAASR